MSAFEPQSRLIQTLSGLVTEQRDPELSELDKLDAVERLQIQNELDSQVAAAVANAIPAIARAVEEIAGRLDAGGRLFYVGAGTSGRLGVLDASECPPTFGTDPEMVQGIIAGGNVALTTAVEGVEDDEAAGAQAMMDFGVRMGDVVVGITASGRTPFVLGALYKARELYADAMGITNNQDNELFLICNESVMVAEVGPEIIAGSTRLKAGTAQKMILNMLTTQTMIHLGKTYGNVMVDVMATNSKLKARATKIVMDIAKVDKATAAKALGAANGNVKLAIVMLVKDVGADMADTLLARAHGRLRDVIG